MSSDAYDLADRIEKTIGAMGSILSDIKSNKVFQRECSGCDRSWNQVDENWSELEQELEKALNECRQEPCAATHRQTEENLLSNDGLTLQQVLEHNIEDIEWYFSFDDVWGSFIASTNFSPSPSDVLVKRFIGGSNNNIRIKSI